MKGGDMSIFQRLGDGRRKPDDPFFQSGDCVCHMMLREGMVDCDDDIDHEAPRNTNNPLRFPCCIPTCNLVLSSLLAFEAHYNSCHRFICSECKKALPSPHLLDLHLNEIHSSFFSIQAERQPMYQCFVEACEHMSQTPKERHDHCINVHKFPHDFRFDKFTRSKKEKKHSKRKERKRGGGAEDSEMRIDGAAFAAPTAAASSSFKGPFSFGHSSAKGRMFVPRTVVRHQAKVDGENQKKEKDSGDQESLTLSQLMDTLPPLPDGN